MFFKKEKSLRDIAIKELLNMYQKEFNADKKMINRLWMKLEYCNTNDIIRIVDAAQRFGISNLINSVR